MAINETARGTYLDSLIRPNSSVWHWAHGCVEPLKQSLETPSSTSAQEIFESALDVTFHEAWYDDRPKEYDIPGNPEEGTGTVDLTGRTLNDPKRFL
jgi:hypothetical protein